MKLILASQSHRRRELATSAGWDITITPPPECAEASAPPLQPDETVQAFVTRLAHAKAEAVSKQLPPSEARAILACDTVGEIGGVIFGKPTDTHDARRMIEALSGKKHQVLTGVSIWFPEPTERIKANTSPRQYHVKEGCAISEVFMELLPKKEIDDYLATNDWHGKAGACGFQDGRLPLRLITGSIDAVVGLPVKFIEQLVVEHLGSR